MNANCKRLGRYILRFLFSIFLALIIYALGIFFGATLSTHPPKIYCQQSTTVYVLSNGIHLDLVLPTTALSDSTLSAFQISTKAQYVSFGWGDRQFYLETPTWSELRIGIATKAVLLPTKTALHVEQYRTVSKAWNAISVCDSQLAKLVEHVSESVQRDSQNRPILIEDPGYTPTDRFFEARGSYYFLNTCNNWVNRGLKRARVKTAIWSPLHYGLLHQLSPNAS